jgi:RNA polymerase sigma-70 factor (ECF subfamily)
VTTEATDAELVAGVRRGSREAAERLAARHLRGCRAVALAIVGEIAGAEDACQDGFVYAIERIDDCRDPDRFGAWLRQIVRNRARNHVRDERRDRMVALDQVAEPVAESSPARDAERADIRDRLLAALRTLPEDRREVVLLHDLEGWTHREIAERMDLPAGTVRSHLHFARKALRALLGAHGRDIEG